MKKIRNIGSKIMTSILSIVVMLSLVQLPVYAAEVSGEGYSINKDTGVLTITTNEGTINWRDDPSILRKDVKSVVLTDNVTELKNFALNTCSNLTYMNTNKVTTIGAQSFVNTGLLSIDMPNVETINTTAFGGLYNLSKVNMPKIKNIGKAAFYSCRGLKEITLPAIPPTIVADSFSSVIATITLVDNKGITLSGLAKINALSAYEESANYADDKWAGQTLPQVTDNDKLLVVKAAIETALKAMSVSNDTTKNDVNKVISDAITTTKYATEASALWDSTKGFSITKATSSKTGTVTGTINLSCGSATDSIVVNLTIAKLPKTEDEKLREALALVKSALDKIEPTNSLTKIDIENIVKNTLDNYTYGNEIKYEWMEGFDIVKATITEPGYAKGRISFWISSKEAGYNITFEVEIPAIGVTPEKPVITVGAGFTHEISNGKNITLTCSGKLEDLTGIYIDGQLVDAKHYTLKSGSTILTLKTSYLDTLSAGKHTLKFQYKDNISAETIFMITAKVDTPKTDDISNSILYFSLIALSGCVVTFLNKKRKELSK